VILAVLGLATLAIGVMLPAPGLTAAGALWLVLGLAAFLNNRRVTAKRADNLARAAAGELITGPAVTGRALALGVALLLAIGVPSLAIGVLELGIDSADSEWRWLPMLVGAVAVVLALVAVVLSASGVRAGASAGGVSLPARVTIRSMRETGTRVNGMPRIEFDLLVEPDGLTSFEATHRIVVPFTALGAIGIGAGFRATVAGTDDSAPIQVAWDQPITDAPS
jgi:hypothetical protein